jgi:O-antigen/teichoic acid export membrane protein
VTGFVVFMAMPGVVFAYFCGRSLLTLIYGHQYAVAAVPLFLAACCALIAFVNNQITTAFYAAGTPQEHRLCVVMMAVVMIVLTYPLAKWMGPAGGQLASLSAITVGFLIQLNRARHLIGIRISQYGKLLLQGLAVSAAVLAAGLMAQTLAVLERPIFTVGLGLLGCAVAYGVAGWIFTRNPKVAEDYT